MKRVLKWMAVMSMLIGAVNIDSCKKDSSPSTGAVTIDESQQQVTTAADESTVASESDEAVMDANVALTKSQFNGQISGDVKERIEGGDVVLDDVNKVITIKYDGKTVGRCGRLREGIIIVKLTNGINWSDKGAEITITFQGFKITKTCRGKTREITFNGSKTIKNVLGGLFCHMMPGDSIVYEAKGSAEINFDGKLATWNIARRMTYTMHADLVKRIVIDGIGPGNAVIWGSDRYGREFEVDISQTIKRNSKCGYENATAGVKVYSKLPREITVTFGVDKNGNPVTAEDCSAYGYKAVWINAQGKVVTNIRPYEDD